VPTQHRADGSGGDLDAKALQFALDALVEVVPLAVELGWRPDG
jgi:hypothetical protein